MNLQKKVEETMGKVEETTRRKEGKHLRYQEETCVKES